MACGFLLIIENSVRAHARADMRILRDRICEISTYVVCGMGIYVAWEFHLSVLVPVRLKTLLVRMYVLPV